MRARTLSILVLGVLACPLLLGCAIVNPKADFQRADRLVENAIGQSIAFRPGEEVAAANRIEEIVAGGITAAEAAELSLLNNPRLQAELLEIGIGRADVVQSGLFSNPTLSVSVLFPEGGGRSNIQAGLAQSIVDLWQLPKRKLASERELDRTILSIAREVSVVALDAKLAYFKTVRADRERDLTNENLAITQQSLDLTIDRRDAGSGSDVDVNLARIQHLKVELRLRNVTLAATEARSELAKLLGLTTSPDKLVLSDSLIEPQAWTITPEIVIETARESRLDLKAATVAIEAASARVSLEYRKIFPDITIGPALERNERRALPGRNILADTARASVANGGLTAPEIQSRGQRDEERDQEIDAIFGPALSLTLPIFDQNQAQIAKAEYERDQLVRLFEALDIELTQEAYVTFQRARTAFENALFYRDSFLPLQKQSLELATEAYKAGRTPFLSVLNAQSDFIEARAGLVEVLAAHALASVELERVTGRPIATLMDGR